MKRLFSIFITLFILIGCGSVNVKNIYTPRDNAKIFHLTNELDNLSHNHKESSELAVLAITYPRVLAKEYNLVKPPSYHNFLVNQGLRKRGLCYHWVEDIYKEIKSRHFKSFDFKWGRANADRLNEHNVLVVVAKGSNDFKNGIILDAWRNSGELVFHKVKDDKEYDFKEWKEGNLKMKNEK